MPTFIEYMLNGFKKNSVATYCAQMAHSYIQWGIIPCKVKRGYIDCGGVMLKLNEAKAVGWNNVTDHSADWLFFNDIANRYGYDSFTVVPGLLFIHN